MTDEAPTLLACPHTIRGDNRTVARVMTRVSRGKRASAGDAVTRPSGAGTFGSLRHRPLPQCYGSHLFRRRYQPSLRRFEAFGGARHTSARTHVCTAPGCEVSLV